MKPSIFISSTFFDLKEIRVQLVKFLEVELGYTSIAFESISFAIEPDETAIENCRRRVALEADVLILVLGSRYGSREESTNKSVTNLEYLAARAKGIPVYVFVEKQVLTLCELWRKNPGNTFDGLVDSVALFEFVKTIRDEHKAFTFPFESADDIVERMRVQFADLVKRSLNDRLSLHRLDHYEELSHLSPAAFKIALEKPPAWEYLLFSQTLKDEIKKNRRAREDYEEKFVVGEAEEVGLRSLGWVSSRMHELMAVVPQLTKIINDDFRIAVGASGESADERKIDKLSRRMVEIYRFCIDWSQRVRSASFAEEMAEVQLSLSRFADDVIRKVEIFSKEFAGSLVGIGDKIARGEKVEIKIQLELTTGGAENEFYESLELAKRRLGV